MHVCEACQCGMSVSQPCRSIKHVHKACPLTMSANHVKKACQLIITLKHFKKHANIELQMSLAVRDTANEFVFYLLWVGIY